MKVDIDFKGLSHCPSDHECQEGDLGAMVNLIPEDGALIPLTLDGSTVAQIPASCRIITTHRGNGFTHWILECTADGATQYRWMNVPGATTEQGGVIFLGDGFETQDVTAIGNMVCFVGAAQTKYAIWRDDDYQVISMRDLDYTMTITNDCSERIGSAEAVDMGDDFLGCFSAEADAFHPDKDEEGFPIMVRKVTVTKEGAARIWGALDAKLSEKIAGQTGEYLRHIVIGVAAVQLYDGSLVNISDFFMLLPRDSVTQVTVDRAESTVHGQTFAHAHRVSVSMPYKSLLGDLVTGVSIFLTRGDMFLKLDKAYDVQLETGISPTFRGTFSYDRLTEDELYKAVDGESFYLMDTIGMDKIGMSGAHYIPAQEVNMHEVTGAEEHMTLAGMRRGDTGGNVCFAYNNRLHIGGVRQMVGTPFSPKIIQRWGEAYGPTDTGTFMGEAVDGPPHTGEMSMDMALSVKTMSSGQSITLHYALQDLTYPYGPVIGIPYAFASGADVIIRLAENISGNIHYAYYRKHVRLHQSDSWGCSYFIDTGRFGIRLSQVREYDVQNGRVMTPRERDDWEVVEKQVFDDAFSHAAPAVLPGNASLLKVSEVENPLVWPSGGNVTVGTGKIMTMAANTESVSDGQFGDFLYVFTDQGLWLMDVDRSNGLYTMAHEMSRDVLTDVHSVTPMAKGVLYTTSRGLMAAYGKKIECLSESLRGVPWMMTSMPHGADVAAMRDSGATASEVQYVRLSQFICGARILYDYANQRVFLFHKDYEYGYVLSLRSGMWGAVESRLIDTVPSYLTTMAVVEKYEAGETVREIVEISGVTHQRIGVLACTRPMALGMRHVHKSVMAAVVRGHFHGRGSGENSRIGCMIWGSNDLWHWHAVMSSRNQYLRGRVGTPWKWWRIAIVGQIEEGETIDGVTLEVTPRMANRIR